ncbi:putative sugar phosphotransferase component II B [Geomicrobium sp. JCM 19055]|nr:putative sugar phosphotransferase component II B [Geomicrobium sp. JCM 19055]
MIVEMNAKSILKDLQKEADVSHTDLTTAKTEQADLYIGSDDIVNNLQDGSRHVVGLKNLLDKNELREVLDQNL